MKKVLFLIALILFCAAVGKGLYFARNGFTLHRVVGWDKGMTIPWGDEVDRALSQRYHYLGRGRQCFAFASEDGQYVLKFPRTDTHRLPFWARAFGTKSFCDRELAMKTAARMRVQDSFDLAYEELKESSAVVAIHLGPTEDTGRVLDLRDALGTPVRLPLDKTTFVLQYKKPILSEVFLQALKLGDRDRAKKVLTAFVEIVNERGRRKILNRDERFIENYGFDGEKAFQIDIGSYYKMSDLNAWRKSREDTMRPVREWLAKLDPEMAEYIDQKLAL